MTGRRPTTGAGKRGPVAQTPGQLGLFGSDIPPAVPTQRRGHAGDAAETNDMDLITTIAANASRDLYVLVGPNERVYVRTDAEGRDVARVPRFEEAAVHQLLRRGWLTVGGATKDLGCGAATFSGHAVNCPASTRTKVTRWNALSRPSSWSASTTAATSERPALRVVKGGQR